MTLGWYESQLLSRVDPSGRTLGRFFAEEVGAQLRAEFHIGLPDDIADERIATIHAYRPPEMLLHLGDMPRTVLLGMLNPRSVLLRSMRALPELMDPDAWNRRETLRLEVPSVNGTGEVRAIARVYGSLATGGGSLAFADPDVGVGYAYAMNRLGFHMPVDPRELAIRRAFYATIGGPPQS